jgi:hypothetical protein
MSDDHFTNPTLEGNEMGEEKESHRHDLFEMSELCACATCFNKTESREHDMGE